MNMKARERQETGNGAGPQGIKSSGNGQDSNNVALARMLERSPEEQKYALSLMAKNQRAIAYIAAFHPEGKLREAAFSFLDGEYSLLLVSRSSPHRQSVSESLNKLGKMVDSLDGAPCLEVAMRSPHKEDRFDAFHRAKDLVESGKIILRNGNTFGELLQSLEGEDPARIMEFVTSVESLERAVIGADPYGADEICSRKGGFSEESLLLLLERG